MMLMTFPLLLDEWADVKMRTAKLERETTEVKIRVNLNLDGEGKSKVNTGIRFFDHMLSTLAKHSYWNLEVDATGDLIHHLMEDVAIVLGEAARKALGEKLGIRRFGFSIVPMDDSLVRAAIDLGGRAYIHLELGLKGSDIEGVKVEDIEHFFLSLGEALKANIHISLLYGKNDHHKVEAAIKALAVALREAVRIEERVKGEKPSVKGVL